MKHIKAKKLIIITTAFLLIASAVTFATIKRKTNSKTATTRSGGSINYSPPTKEEVKQADENKEQISKQSEEQPKKTSTGKQNVTVVITSVNPSDQDVTIISYVQGIFEDDGNCTATLTKGSSKVAKKGKAFADVSTTVCEPIIIPRSEFSGAGDWQLIVSYESPTAEGASKIKMITLK